MKNRENLEKELNVLTGKLNSLKAEMKNIQIRIKNIQNEIISIEKNDVEETNSDESSDKDMVINVILSKYLRRYRDEAFLSNNLDKIRKELREKNIYLKTIDISNRLRDIRKENDVVETLEIKMVDIDEINRAITKNERWNLFQKITGYTKETMYMQLMIIEIKKIDTTKKIEAGITYHTEKSKRIKEWKYIYTCLDGTPDMRYKDNGYPIYATDYIVKIILNTGYIIELTLKNDCRNFYVELKNHLINRHLI